MTHLKADPKALDEQAEDFGYTAFGPLILAFSAWLEEEAEKRGIHRLYFLSREGYFLLQLYKEALRLGLCRLSNIDARYLYISRRATFGAAEKTPETLDLMLRSGQFQGPLYDLLDARLGLSRDFCEDHGLPNVTVDVENDSKAVLDLLKPILPALQKKTASERAPLEQYLRQEGFFDDQLVGLVDVGYSASIQRWLWMLTKRDLTGFYFATTDAVNEWQNPHNLVLGCFATECSLTKMPPVYRYALASESWLTAPTGQVLQFKMEGDTAVPVFASPGRSQDQFNIPEAVAKGAARYMQDIAFVSEFDRAWAVGVKSMAQDLLATAMESPAFSNVLRSLSIEDEFSGKGESSLSERDADFPAVRLSDFRGFEE